MSRKQPPRKEDMLEFQIPSNRMGDAELRRIIEDLWGYGGQTRLAEVFGINGSTVRRWLSGAIPIPGPVSVALRYMLKTKQMTKRRRTVDNIVGKNK